MAIDPSAVTIHDVSEIAPTPAMFAGSMMMPEPIMFTATMNVSCTTFIFFLSDIPFTPSRNEVNSLHTEHVEHTVDFFGAFHFLGEPGEHVAPFLKRA